MYVCLHCVHVNMCVYVHMCVSYYLYVYMHMCACPSLSMLAESDHNFQFPHYALEGGMVSVNLQVGDSVRLVSRASITGYTIVPVFLRYCASKSRYSCLYTKHFAY